MSWPVGNCPNNVLYDLFSLIGKQQKIAHQIAGHPVEIRKSEIKTYKYYYLPFCNSPNSVRTTGLRTEHCVKCWMYWDGLNLSQYKNCTYCPSELGKFFV